MVVEMLGATATMLYGLNIIMDPVHEELEMEPDAPGITKVTHLFLPQCPGAMSLNVADAQQGQRI